MAKMIVLGFGLLVCACAALKTGAAEPGADRAQTSESVADIEHAQHPLYVGRGSDGELVMASTHHDAMNGLSVANSDIGATGRQDSDLICKREMLTGSHLPQWTCRYKADVERDRMRAQTYMQMPKACLDKACHTE